MSQNKEKYFIWFIQGGLGKNVVATSLLETIKLTYPDRKLILVATWPQVFLNNPNVDRVYNISNIPHFYEDYIEGKDIIICNQEPYNQTGHITKQNHLLESWCELLNIKYKNQTPQIFYNFAELQSYQKNPTSKPILLLQTGGGPMENNSPYNWTRDIPKEFAQLIVQKYLPDYDIIQITKPNGYILDNVNVINKPMTNLNLFALLFNSSKRILIDSCLQHAAAAFHLPSTVLWIGTSPIVFGYKEHKNIVAKIPKKANQLIDSTLFDYQFLENEYQCPYMELNEIFSLETLDNL